MVKPRSFELTHHQRL